MAGDMQQVAATRPPRRRQILWIGLALVILLLAAGALYFLQSGEGPGSRIKRREDMQDQYRRRQEEPARSPRQERPGPADDPRRDRPRIEPD
jgi:hypothetical protein